MDTISKMPFDVRDDVMAQNAGRDESHSEIEKEGFCLPCWASITLLVVVVIWLFVPVIWYMVKYGIQ